MKFQKNDKILNKFIKAEDYNNQLNEEIIFGLVIIASIIAAFI